MSDQVCPRCGAKKAFAQGPSYIDFSCGSYIARESGGFSGGCKEQTRSVPISTLTQAIEALESSLEGLEHPAKKQRSAIAALKEVSK